MKIIMAVVIAALAVAVVSSAALASPPSQAIPDCSIEDKDTGDSMASDGSARVTPLQTLRVICDVSDNSKESPWNLSTEILNPKWVVSDANDRHPPVFNPVISLEEYSDRLEIELTGNVDWPKAPINFGSVEAPYVSETAPEIRTRIITVADESGAPPVHVEVIAVHPDYLIARAAISALDDVDSSVAEYVQPIRAAGESAMSAGKPWQAIQIIETMKPILDTATEQQRESEEMRRESESFWTLELFIGIGMGFGVAVAIVILVVLVMWVSNNRGERNSGVAGAQAGGNGDSIESEPTTRRRRRRQPRD